MTDASDAARRQRLGLIVLVSLGLIAGGVSFLGTRASWPSAEVEDSINTAGDGSHFEIALPSGPHQAEFQAACIICHSARLPLTQPQLTREKWIEIVHKMAAAYGAPVTPTDEAHIVEYLLTIQQDRS